MLTTTLAVATAFGSILLTANPDSPKSKGVKVQTLRRAVRDLSSDLERLQDEIVDARTQLEKPQLYRKTDTALRMIVNLGAQLDKQPNRENLYKTYGKADKLIRQLLAKTETVDVPGLRRAASRVRDANLELHFALFSGDLAKERRVDVTHRQIEAFLSTVERFERLAQFQLAAPVVDAVKEVEKQSKRLEEIATRTDNPKDLRRQFMKLRPAWLKLTTLLGDLELRRMTYLLRTAARLDRFHRRVFELLEVKGKRVHLDIPI